MSFDLSKKFVSSVEPLSGVLIAVERDDFTTAQDILNSDLLSKSDLDDLAWQCGRDGHEEFFTEVLSSFKDSSYFAYLDGKLVRAINETNHPEIQEALELGADLYQDNHHILCDYIINNDVQMTTYLMDLGLDPKIAFSDADMKYYEGNKNLFKNVYGFERLEYLRGSAIADNGQVKSPIYTVKSP